MTWNLSFYTFSGSLGSHTHFEGEMLIPSGRPRIITNNNEVKSKDESDHHHQHHHHHHWYQQYDTRPAFIIADAPLLIYSICTLLRRRQRMYKLVENVLLYP